MPNSLDSYNKNRTVPGLMFWFPVLIPVSLAMWIFIIYWSWVGVNCWIERGYTPHQTIEDPRDEYLRFMEEPLPVTDAEIAEREYKVNNEITKGGI